MVGLILREQIADEAAMSRRAFLQGTGLLLGFALTGANTESVSRRLLRGWAKTSSRVLSRDFSLRHHMMRAAWLVKSARRQCDRYDSTGDRAGWLSRGTMA